MKHEWLLGFSMTTIGCAFLALGILLAFQRPDVVPLVAAVAALGLALALFSTATFMTEICGQQ